MNREEIISFLVDAGVTGVISLSDSRFEALERFAALVAAASEAKERERFNALLEDYRAVLETLEQLQ